MKCILGAIPGAMSELAAVADVSIQHLETECLPHLLLLEPVGAAGIDAGSLPLATHRTDILALLDDGIVRCLGPGRRLALVVVASGRSLEGRDVHESPRLILTPDADRDEIRLPRVAKPQVTPPMSEGP